MAISLQPLSQITWSKDQFVAKDLYFVCPHQSKVNLPQVFVVCFVHHIKVRHCNSFGGHCNTHNVHQMKFEAFKLNMTFRSQRKGYLCVWSQIQDYSFQGEELESYCFLCLLWKHMRNTFLITKEATKHHRHWKSLNLPIVVVIPMNIVTTLKNIQDIWHINMS